MYINLIFLLLGFVHNQQNLKLNLTAPTGARANALGRERARGVGIAPLTVNRYTIWTI